MSVAAARVGCTARRTLGMRHGLWRWAGWTALRMRCALQRGSAGGAIVESATRWRTAGAMFTQGAARHGTRACHTARRRSALRSRARRCGAIIDATPALLGRRAGGAALRRVSQLRADRPALAQAARLLPRWLRYARATATGRLKGSVKG